MKLVTLLNLIDGKVNIVLYYGSYNFKTIYFESYASLLLENDSSSLNCFYVVGVYPSINNDNELFLSVLVKEAA